MNTSVASISALFCGAIIGTMFGFIFTGHKAIISEIELKNDLGIWKLLFRRTEDFSLSEIAILMLFSGCWFIIFIVLVVTPIWLAEGSPLFEASILLFTTCLTLKVGVKLFRRFHIVDDAEVEGNVSSET